jgi:alpha-1,6-mannosyltransferase
VTTTGAVPIASLLADPPEPPPASAARLSGWRDALWAMGPAARRCLLVGFAGTTAMAVAATAVGAVPVGDALGGWPSPWSPGRPWQAVLLAYLGLTLLVVAWWRLPAAIRDLPGRLRITLTCAAAWAVPLVLAPPLYSRDLYSYLAQGVMYSGGLDPYRAGPAALGGPLADNVSVMWQNAPAPYGPLFLGIASGVTSATGPRIVLAVIGMRVAMLAALAVTAACLVPLARRCRVDPAQAMWLAIANPLVLAHVVSGAHNDVLIVMLICGGLLLAMQERPTAAAVLLGLGVLVKAPAGLALLVVVPAMARRLSGRYRWARATLLVAAAAVGASVAVTSLTGTWYGWVAGLTDTVRVRNGLSITTDAGMGLARLLAYAGWDDETAVVSLVRVAGLVVALALIGRILIRHRGRPVYAAGLMMVTLVLLAPVVHPWYALWGLAPLAASARSPRVRAALVWLSVGLVFYPMPWGEGFTPQLSVAVVGVIAGLAVAWASSGMAGDHRRVAPVVPNWVAEGRTPTYLRVG